LSNPAVCNNNINNNNNNNKPTIVVALLVSYNICPYRFEGRLQGKKTLGRPRAMLLDAMMYDDDKNESDCAKFKEKAHDRETWRH